MIKKEFIVGFSCQFYFLPFFTKGRKIKLSCNDSELPKVSISNKIKFLFKKEYPNCRCKIISRSLRSYPQNDLFVVIVPNWKKDDSRKVNSVNFYLVTALDEDDAYASIALAIGKYVTKKTKVSVSKLNIILKEAEKKKIQMSLFTGN